MAPSRPRAWWSLPAACAASLAAAAGPPAPAPSAASAPVPDPAGIASTPTAQLPIVVDAASSDVDYGTHAFTFEKVTITQGALRVQADHAHATGLDFANSHWTFDGHVRIDAEPRGNLRSDQAVVEFRDKHIARATITGKPAEFEQPRPGAAEPARGHAEEIVYDVDEGTVRLKDDAWLSDGQNEISGPLLVYNIRAQRIQAASEGTGDERVHITISPQSVPRGGPQPKPAGQP